jgi:hypothetical protein
MYRLKFTANREISRTDDNEEIQGMERKKD